jgi:hypothetical protein
MRGSDTCDPDQDADPAGGTLAEGVRDDRCLNLRGRGEETFGGDLQKLPAARECRRGTTSVLIAPRAMVRSLQPRHSEVAHAVTTRTSVAFLHQSWNSPVNSAFVVNSLIFIALAERLAARFKGEIEES